MLCFMSTSLMVLILVTLFVFQINNMLESWELRERVHLFVRDNAANMVKGLNDVGLPHIGCFAHTLQLVVHDALLNQRMISDMLAISRQIISFQEVKLGIHSLGGHSEEPWLASASISPR